MKNSNKRELQQIALNHSSDIDLKDFVRIYRKCTAEPYYFLVYDTTLLSDNPLRFRKRLLMIRLKIKNFNMILIEKLQKYQPCHKAKLLSMNILLVNKYDLLIKNK